MAARGSDDSRRRRSKPSSTSAPGFPTKMPACNPDSARGTKPASNATSATSPGVSSMRNARYGESAAASVTCPLTGISMLAAR
nr:hypothetical protein [Paenibacillus glycinis]